MVYRVYVDTGSSANIMYEHCFEKLSKETQNFLRPAAAPVIGFSGEPVWPRGKIHLPLTMLDWEKNHEKTVLAEFIVIKAPSRYNAILGRTGLFQLQAIASTVHGLLKMPSGKGVITVRRRHMPGSECSDAAPQDTWTELEEVQVVINPEYPDQTVRIGGNLPKALREDLEALLKKHKQAFAWEPKDMSGVSRSVVEHKLNVNPVFTPVKQSKRPMARERNDIINKEVRSLVEAGVLRSIQYPEWIANPVLVKKGDGSMRMCVDFKDLNKACPKDSYPLPEIEQKIESLGGYKWKSFLDAYKGYHQVQMAKEDEGKTAFHTEKGTFCYIKMPFGLRNAGATYQRLVDRAFEGQVGRNVEVYVDDMVIKSKKDDSLLKDTEETLLRLRAINMKLNPKKCSFGMSRGKFLGHIVTTEGIQANPEKINSIIQMKTPKTVKDVQSLNGKLAALGRFLAKSAEKSVPFFKALHGHTKKGEIQWSPEADEAFIKLKQHLRVLPTLRSEERRVGKEC